MEVLLERLIVLFNNKTEIKHRERNEKIAELDTIALNKEKEIKRSKVKSPLSYRAKFSSSYMLDGCQSESYRNISNQNIIQLANPLKQRNSTKKIDIFIKV